MNHSHLGLNGPTGPIYLLLQFHVALTMVCAWVGVNLLQMYLIGHLTLDPHHRRPQAHHQILLEQVSCL